MCFDLPFDLLQYNPKQSKTAHIPLQWFLFEICWQIILLYNIHVIVSWFSCGQVRNTIWHRLQFLPQILGLQRLLLDTAESQRGPALEGGPNAKPLRGFEGLITTTSSEFCTGLTGRCWKMLRHNVVNMPPESPRGGIWANHWTNQLSKWSKINQHQLSYINYPKQSPITLITNHPCCQVDASTPLSHVETKPPQFVVPPGTQNVRRTWKSMEEHPHRHGQSWIVCDTYT